MTGILASLAADVLPFLIGAVSIAGAFVVALFVGRRGAKAERRAQDAEGHIETERRTRDASAPSTDPAAARQRMRERAK